jgi:amino acid transporter
MDEKTTAGKSLGVAACTAIVVGNMVGTGFYLSPSAVAPYGNLAIIAWLVMGAGAACLGLTFAKLARLAPATGGPYAYTRMGYGDFAGFLIAWGYWISIWASLPVIAIAFSGAVIDLFPFLRSRPMVAALTLGAIWVVVLINLRGVKAAGIFAEVTTYSKLVPFAAMSAEVAKVLTVSERLLLLCVPSGIDFRHAKIADRYATEVVVKGLVERDARVSRITAARAKLQFHTVASAWASLYCETA